MDVLTIQFLVDYWWLFAAILVLVLWYLSFAYLMTFVKRRLILRIRKEVKQEMEREVNLKLLKDEIEVRAEPAAQSEAVHQTFSRKYELVTVLFADIQGFTKIVEHINPEMLVDQLDRYFFRFDEIVERLSIEKIKTIGDAYMCAGGIPEKNRTNPVEVVLAAMEMQRFMKQVQAESPVSDSIWELRIGIHTGPVVSGLIGRKKITFDIWGDSVNIASRMESSGIAGEINITGVTYQYIRDFFNCQYRGKMPIKYKGETDMYFVKGIVPELSEGGLGLVPNQKFLVRLQQMRFSDLEEVVLDRLRNELSDIYCFHNVFHTVDVLTQAEILARGEGIGDEDLLLVKTAALLHDSGFLIGNDNHEGNSILIAREILPKFKYTEEQIELVVKLISATQSDDMPTTLLEEIIKDADLNYLGRPDCMVILQNRYKEMVALGDSVNMTQWMSEQYSIIQNHRYFTGTGKRLRQVNRIRQLEKVKILMEVA